MISKRQLIRGLGSLALGLSADALVRRAHARGGFPTKPVKIVVPFPPGTPSEPIVRALAQHLGSQFGQPFVIENRPGGAGGTVGAASVAQAEPDGHTLLASPPGPLTTADQVFRNVGYDPATAFAPVALLFKSPQLFVINPSVPANTLSEFIAYAKANPGKVSFASPGFGTQPHLLGEMFRMQAGVDIVHVPYKGPALALTDLLSGQVQMGVETAPLILPQATTGKLKVLAVADDKPAMNIPRVPTTAQLGFPELKGLFWSSIVAPAGTPAATIAELNDAIRRIMKEATLKVTLDTLAATPADESPQGFAAFIQSERSRWAKVIRDGGLRMN